MKMKPNQLMWTSFKTGIKSKKAYDLLKWLFKTAAYQEYNEWSDCPSLSFPCDPVEHLSFPYDPDEVEDLGDEDDDGLNHWYDDFSSAQFARQIKILWKNNEVVVKYAYQTYNPTKSVIFENEEPYTVAEYIGKYLQYATISIFESRVYQIEDVSNNRNYIKSWEDAKFDIECDKALNFSCRKPFKFSFFARYPEKITVKDCCILSDYFQGKNTLENVSKEDLMSALGVEEINLKKLYTGDIWY